VVVLAVMAGCLGSLPAVDPKPTVDNIPQDPPEVHPEASLNSSEVRQMERTVLKLTNQKREQRGRDKLSRNTELARINDYHAWHMWDQDYFFHVEPDGDDHDDRIEQFGYQCPEPSSEIQASNIIQNQESLNETARELVNSWMGSTGHRRALLDDGYNVAGVGIYIDQKDTVYAVMVFCQEVNERPANVRGTNETVPQPPNETAT
jgi:uncharacterized protein YkwD